MVSGSLHCRVMDRGPPDVISDMFLSCETRMSGLGTSIFSVEFRTEREKEKCIKKSEIYESRAFDLQVNFST